MPLLGNEMLEMFKVFALAGSARAERIAELEPSLTRGEGEGRESSTATAMAIAERAHARLGLLGNPSDIYGGKALAVSVANYAATVTLRANLDSKDETISVVPGEGEREGGVKLIESLLSVFFDDPPLRHLRSERQTGFTLTYTSNIPYQVGLSGSSAIVCAALRCLVRYYEVEELIPRARLPNLVLEAETKLGIVAGYMDRVQQVSEGEEGGGERARATRTERPREEEADADAAPHAFTLLDPSRAVPAEQVYGGLVFMDFNSSYFESEGFGRYERLDVSRLPRLHLMHLRESGGQSGRIHSDVRRRFLEGDTEVAEAMREFAGIAERGRSILVGSAEGGEDGAVAEALAGEMRSNFALRRKLFGDAVLGAENLEMVELAESMGAAAKFTGSGGAIAVLCPDGDRQVRSIAEECDRRGFAFVEVDVAPASEW